jgi:hypothetical protein
LFGAVFVGVEAAIYWFTSYEDAGTVLLILGAGMYAILAGYLFVQSRRLAEPRPEDSEDGATAADDTTVGYFPAASVWPAAMALGAVVAALGLVFGFWFFIIAAILFVGAIIGYAVEAQARP